MKFFLPLICFCCISLCCIAQSYNGDYEVKVVSYRYKTTKGQLKKITPEGIGIEDYRGNYIIYRTPDIVKIKVKKRGLTFGKAVSSGTLLGLAIGGGLWSLDENGENAGDMAKLTVVLTASGAVVGTAVGGIAELSNKKLTLNVNGNQEYFKKNYQRLEKYVNHAPETLHVNN
ncbi:hypothetical protein [Pedobacter xixiisoli]|uniref:Uncharacterized protein n=1 Tax=Pedobacter xixiisoli TaxID=1476464 RepID=A0A285ZYU0_9SPHI|nr:hypothetical protein [Pedobacter xixiisoli]SOD14799.1 hypothetical protein SAMN06297358_1761 [Pedobacter xixiisoli]